MARVLSDDDVDAIAQRLISFSGLTNEEHKKQHEAFAIYIEKQVKRAEFCGKVQQQVGGWAIITIISAIGYGAWNGFIHLAQKAH